MKLKRLLLASALALSFVVSTPSVAKADPISAAIVTFIGFTGTAATVATFVINSALYAAGSWAVGKAAQALGLVKSAVAERQASVTTLSLGETPRELIVGQACTGGTLIDAFNFGGKYGTDTVTRCIGLADHELAGIVGYYVDDQYYPWLRGGEQPGFSGKLSIDFRNARDVGWTPPVHAAQMGGWAASDRLCSIAHVWIDTRIDDKVWTQGHPRFRFVLNGLKAYDPRKDAALGYTGPSPHVWEDVGTHEFTQNAEVLRYNFQRGIYAAGKHGQAEHLLIGRGLSAEEAPPHRVIAAANLCDEMVEGERRYTANGVISASQSFIDVEEMFAAAMAGVIVQRDGGVEVEPGQAKATFLTITDADLAAGEPVSFTEFQPDTDGGRINTVVPRYVEPAQGFKDHGGPPRRDAADIQEDGGPREMTLPLMLVTSGKQADRCAEIARRRARLERRASIVLPPDFAEIEEGDWIPWKSDRYHGGATVRYQVTSYSLDEKWRQHLSLEEIASSVYGVPDPIEDRADPPPPPTPTEALFLDGVSAEAIILAETPEEEEDAEPVVSAVVPAVRFKWDIEDSPVDVAVRAIRAEIRLQGSEEVSSVRTDDVSLGVLVTTNGVAPNQILECRLVPIGEPWRPVVPSPWLVVTTGRLIADDVSDDAPALTDIRAEARAKAALLIKEALSRWNRDETDKRFAIQNVEYVSEQLAITRQTLELADQDQFALLEVERGARIDGITAETTARQLQISGVEDALAIVDDFSRTTATALAAETEVRNTQVSSLGTSLALVDTKATTAVSAANAASAATTALASEVEGVEANATLALSTSADLATQLGEASFAVEVAAGGDPAMIYARAKGSTSVAGMVASVLRFANSVSGTVVEAMRLVAGEVFFMRPIYIDVGSRRLIVGPGSDWVMWFGPNTITAASATRINGHWAFGSDGKVYYGSSELTTGGGGFHAQADAAIRVGSRTSPGLVTTSTLRITVSGATGTVTWQGAVMGGADDWVITNASGTVSGSYFETAFRASVSTPGEQKRGQFAFLVTDAGSGKSFTIPAAGAAIYNV